MHRSGTNEEITEKGQLLQELSDIYADKDSASQRQAEATQEQRQLAAQAREDACLTLGQRVEPVEPPAKRKPTSTDKVLEYLQIKHADISRLKEEELLMERQKNEYMKGQNEERLKMEQDRLAMQSKESQDRLALEKRRLDAEEKDREHRRAMERLDRQEQQKRDEAMAEERKAFMDVMKAFTNKLS